MRWFATEFVVATTSRESDLTTKIALIGPWKALIALGSTRAFGLLPACTLSAIL